jgi:hypothetical protein
LDVCASDNSISLAACISRRGGLLELSDSQSSFVETGSLDQLLRDNPNWRDIQVTGKTMVGNVTLKYPPDITLTNLTVGIIAGGQNHSNGHFGLAQNSVVLRSLVDQNLIPTRSFGLKYGTLHCFLSFSLRPLIVPEVNIETDQVVLFLGVTTAKPSQVP